MPILFKDIWSIPNPKDYKVHFAISDGVEPLDVWVRDRADWQCWQEYRPERDHFNRDYIFALMRFYPGGDDLWLFGGVFKVLARPEGLEGSYTVELTTIGQNFVGRLKLRYRKPGAQGRMKLENCYDSLEVSEVLPDAYSGRVFPGYESIDLTFPELENLVARQRPDWRSALSHVNGVYLITDTATGKRYVGSAYGNDGIWGRWAAYAQSGHGGNKQLRELVGKDLTYPRVNFRYTLLEFFPFGTPDAVVIGREGFWKDVLLTRGNFGLNSN